MHYRPAQLTDLDDLVDTWAALATEQREHGSWIDVDRSRTAVRDRLGQRIVDGGVIIAEDDGTLLGFVSFRPSPGVLTRVERVGIVGYLYVDPTLRGEGVGSQLLARAETALADRGVTVVELEVFHSNEDAYRFYRDRGYRPHRRRLSKRVAGDGAHADDPDRNG